MRYARILSALLTSAAIHACPLCHTQTGEQVRAGILNGSFGLNLLAIALPFPVFAGLVAWLYFGKPTLQPHASTQPRKPAATRQ